MIVVIVALLAVVSVPLAGGSLSHIARLRLAWPGLIGGAIAVQLLIFELAPGQLPGLAERILHLASYGMAVAFLWRNRWVPWLWLVATGGLANLVAIAANGGTMPASPTALDAAGLRIPPGFANSAALRHPHLSFLGDVFSIPQGLPLANVFSGGDVVLAIGLVLLLHTVCRSRLGGLALSLSRFLHRELGGRIGGQTLVGDGVTAADRPPVGPL